MDPQERLNMLYSGDMQSMDVDTRLNHQAHPRRAQPGSTPVPSIQAEQGVSEFDFDPVTPVAIPVNEQFQLSYIRTLVIGIPVEGDRYLTELDQYVRSPSCTIPEMSPLSTTPSDDSGPVVPKELVLPLPDICRPPTIPTMFTPAVTMARFAINDCSGDLSKNVSERFYDGDKFWSRTWDLYFLPIPKSIDEKPFLLIPTVHAQALLDEINSALRINLTLMGQGKQGLVLEFDNDRLPRPEFIGQSQTVWQKNKLIDAIPKSTEIWENALKEVDPTVFKAFEEKIKASVATVKADRAAQKKAKQAKRDAAKKKLEQCLGRMQACFGLRPALKQNVEQPSFTSGQLDPVDVLTPAKFKFHDMPIFISVDVEWMEDYGVLTEVGISTLDMYNLQDVVPGDFGHMWLSKIQSRHLRVEEHRHYVNTKYLQGCPGNFDYGKSEFIPNAEIAKAVDDAFFKVPPLKSTGEKRTVILVGLNLQSDIMILQRKGCKTFRELDMSLPFPSTPIIKEVVDVAQLYRVYAEESQPPGLANLLKKLQLVGRHLHNAGNDAYHTLEALVTLMLQVAGEKPGAYERNPDGSAIPLPLPKET